MNINKNNFDLTNINTCAVYYFSGTGNTFYCLDQLVKLLKTKNSNLKDIDFIDLSKIHKIGSQRDYDLIIIGYPTYAWYPPKFVKELIKLFPKVENKKVILLSTAASSFGYALGCAKDILIKKNYDVLATLEYIMPSNGTVISHQKFPSEKKIKELINKADNKLKLDLDLIINNNYKIKNTNFFTKILSKILNWGFNKFAIHKQNWKVDLDKCKFCKHCENICPVGNIVVKTKKKKVIFKDKCIFCTRCFNFCKNNAIYFKDEKDKNTKKYNYLKSYFLKNKK